MTDLKPCPFCRVAPFALITSVTRQHYISCQNDDCFVAPTSDGFRTLDEAFAAWNTRAAPAVKPLEWSWLTETNHGFLCSRSSGVLSYSIMTSRNRVYGIAGEHDGAAEFDTLEAAKAAAQADYERRILEALQ